MSNNGTYSIHRPGLIIGHCEKKVSRPVLMKLKIDFFYISFTIILSEKIGHRTVTATTLYIYIYIYIYRIHEKPNSHARLKIPPRQKAY